MKKIVTVLLLLIVFVTFTTKAYAEYPTSSKAQVLIDYETGTILDSKNSDEKLPIASVSKIITMYRVLDKINNQGGSWDTVIPVDDYLIKLSNNAELGNVKLNATTKYTVRDLFNAMVMVSSNSATMALANWVGGTQDQYIKDTRQWLDSIGIKGYEYVTTSGLENTDLVGYWASDSDINSYNKFSASDVAIIGRKLIQDFPEILDTTNAPTVSFAGTPMENNANPFISTNSYPDSSINIDGLKTGFTNIAGYTYIGTAEKNGRRVISVVLNDSNWKEDTDKLLHYGLENFSISNINLTVYSNQLQKIPVESKSKVALSLDKTELSTVTATDNINETVDAVYPEKIKINDDAKVGDIVGEITLYDTNKSKVNIVLTAKEEIKESETTSSSSSSTTKGGTTTSDKKLEPVQQTSENWWTKLNKIF